MSANRFAFISRGRKYIDAYLNKGRTVNAHFTNYHYANDICKLLTFQGNIVMTKYYVTLRLITEIGRAL